VGGPTTAPGTGVVERKMSEREEAPHGSMLDSYSEGSGLIWSEMERCVEGIFELSNSGRVRAAVPSVG
jgi:hypothetical protein